MFTLTDDQAHVLLDAIIIAHHQAHATNFSPWNDYDNELGDDPKADSAGWYELLDEAREALRALLDGKCKDEPAMEVVYDTEAYETYLNDVAEMATRGRAVRVDGRDVLLTGVQHDANGFPSAVTGTQFNTASNDFDGEPITITLLWADDTVHARTWMVL